jgi:hypothetical protein
MQDLPAPAPIAAHLIPSRAITGIIPLGSLLTSIRQSVTPSHVRASPYSSLELNTCTQGQLRQFDAAECQRLPGTGHAIQDPPCNACISALRF